MITYTVTFFSEPDDDAEDVEIRDVQVTSEVAVDDLGAGDYDAHESVVASARANASLDESTWDASHVTFPDGEVAQVPAGL